MSALITLFKNRDDGFLSLLTTTTDGDVLRDLAGEWSMDTRAWAEEVQLRYIDAALSCPSHEQLFRSLFRHAESVHQHRVMAQFLVALDRVVRRQRVVVRRQDDNFHVTEEVLRAISNRSVTSAGPFLRQTQHPATGQPIQQVVSRISNGDGNRLFTQKTRTYLRRRTWAYFRRLSETNINSYVTFVGTALRQYSDDDLATGENIIDHWCLMHICFADSPVLSFGISHISVVSDSQLNDLEPSPWMKEIWESPHARQLLIQLAAESKSRLIRWWASTLHRRQATDVTDCEDFKAGNLIELLGHPSTGIRTAVQQWANTDALDESALSEGCCLVHVTDRPDVFARVLQIVYARRDRLRLDNKCLPFLLASLKTPGCVRHRCWVFSELLRLMSHQAESAERLAVAFAELLPTASVGLRQSILSNLATGAEQSSVLRTAFEEYLPSVQWK
jgi:hypothetical protein